MLDLNSIANSTLAWSQPEAFHRRHVLAAPNGLFLGSLAFEKGWGSLATAQFAESQWTFKRTGFLSPRVTVRQAGSEADAAIFTPAWTGSGSLEFANGRRFRLRSTNFWATDWAFEDEQGNPIVSLHGPKGFLKMGGESVVTHAGAGLAETPVLLLLLWYVRLLMNDDAASTATIVACCG